jgi:hypothetical protein
LCQRELDFVGYWPSENGIKPTTAILQSIPEFSRLADISGLRSFFGLVEQVSGGFTKTEVIEPFRTVLTSKSVFA